jgi:4-hydroxy-2,2'-bipyrrole-5-carbaldehyde O-methyltransferase
MNTTRRDPLDRGLLRRSAAELRDFVRACLAMVRIPRKRAQAMIGIDMRRWNRLHFLHAAVTSGLLDALSGGPRTRDELVDELGVKNVDLLGSLIDLGLATHDLRESKRGVSLRGVRARALWRSDFEGWRGNFVTEATYNSEVYAGVKDRLKGSLPGDYFPRFAEPLAQGSRAVEWFQAPYILRHAAHDGAPTSVYDAGVGSGLYLRYLAERFPLMRGKGVDMDPEIIKQAARRLEAWGIADRFEVAVEDFAAEGDGERYDLVLLCHNLYFFDDASRQRMLRALATRLQPEGRLIVACYLDGGGTVARDLDMLLRSTAGCFALPTVARTAEMLRSAGLEIRRFDRIAPFMPFFGFVCSPSPIPSQPAAADPTPTPPRPQPHGFRTEATLCSAEGMN